MKTHLVRSAASAAFAAVLSMVCVSVSAANLGPVKVNDRLGNGWHMYTEAYVTEQGLVSGVTKIVNYNNAFGFTGGLFVVVVDEGMQPIYTSQVRKWGINAAGFSSKKVRTEVWTEQIPASVLANAFSMAIIQQHTPTQRVWVWILEHRELLLEKAMDFIELFLKIKNDQLTEEDVWSAVFSVAEILQATEGDSWAIDHAQDICMIIKELRDLGGDINGWKPKNHDEIKAAAEMIVAVARDDFDWGDEAQVDKLIQSLVGLLQADTSQFMPQNVDALQSILEKIYELSNDSRVPEEVRSAIADALAKMKELNP